VRADPQPPHATDPHPDYAARQAGDHLPAARPKQNLALAERVAAVKGATPTDGHEPTALGHRTLTNRDVLDLDPTRRDCVSPAERLAQQPAHAGEGLELRVSAHRVAGLLQRFDRSQLPFNEFFPELIPEPLHNIAWERMPPGGREVLFRHRTLQPT